MSEERKWTKGEWRADMEIGEIFAPNDVEIARMVLVRNSGTVGAMWDEAATSANANLIAAAPDLYAALEEFLEIEDNCGGLYAKDGGNVANALAQARTALLRAREGR